MNCQENTKKKTRKKLYNKNILVLECSFNSLSLFKFSFFFIFCRVIQSSHPVCNTIMLFGVIICLVSVILLGIDGQFVTADNYPKVRYNVCNNNTYTQKTFLAIFLSKNHAKLLTKYFDFYLFVNVIEFCSFQNKMYESSRIVL